MAPKPPPHWDLYRDQLSHFDYGHALWETIPVADSKRIQPGDVGYVRNGRFHLLFSASLSPVKESDAPQPFEILTVGKIVCNAPLPAGPLNTETAQVIKECLIPLQSPTPASSPRLSSPTTESASCTSFRLKGGEGALLLTKYPTYREDAEREGHFKQYTRKHYDSWVEFARQNGHGDDGDLNPVLVTGVDRTRDFVMLCYSKDNDGPIDCEFTTPFPGVPDCGRWKKDGFVRTNHSPRTLRGPLPTQATDPTPSGDSDPETSSDQYIFIRYFTVRKRLWVIPKVIKASAGPHELGGGGKDNDGSPLEKLCGSDQDPDLYTPSNLSDGDGCSTTSINAESNMVVHNIRAGGRDDFDVIADYVFQNSIADSVLLHHKDIALLRKLGDGTDLSTLIFEKRPRIIVDRDGVGTIEPRTDDQAGTWDGGVMAPTILSVPGDNRHQVANPMVPLEPQPFSHYQQHIFDSAQELTASDASGLISKSIAPVFGDPMPDWSHTGPQLSEGKGKQVSLPTEFPLGQVGPQQQAKMEQAMTPDDESDVDNSCRGEVHRDKNQQGALGDSQKGRKPSRVNSALRSVKDSVRRMFPGSMSIPVAPPICPNCNIRPVAAKPTAGEFFDFCSKVCATNVKKGNLNSLCEYCKQRPKFKDGTKVHPYCGRRCARSANLPDSFSVLSPMVASSLFCQDPDCVLPAFMDMNGTQSNYCVLHKKFGEQGCISCRAAPSTDKSVLCQPCHDDALSRAPALIRVPEDHKDYKGVQKQFTQTWRHKTTCPEVKAVYKIVVSEASMTQYQQYLDSVEVAGNYVAMGKSRGNENRRWYGTKRKCRLGDSGNETFCADAECALCNIIRTSFDLKFFKAAAGWGRFGRGIYTSSISSKSNDYSKNLGVSSEWKALLLINVVVGNGKKLTRDDTTLTEPPPGYDSVLAEVVPGGALNYDELVVYHNEAVQPSYLVMYESP